MFKTILCVACTLTVAGGMLIAQPNETAIAEDLIKISRVASDSALPWKSKLNLGAGVTTMTLTNWTGGGQNSISLRALVLGTADYAAGSFSWMNEADLGYSIVKQGDLEFRKADDRVILTSKASYLHNSELRYTALLDLRSQFATGYNFDKRDTLDSTQFLKISNLFSPAFIVGGLGGEWTPSTAFKLMLAPVAMRATLVLDDDLSNQGAFGLAPGESFMARVGTLLNASVNYELMENVTWRARWNSFAPYDEFTYWIINVENSIMLKVNDYISVGWLTDMFYDHRIKIVRDDGSVGPSTQLRNQVVITFGYTLKNH